MCKIEEALRRFDGKATTILSEIRETIGDQEVLLSKLIGLVGHEEATISDGATWLLKDILDDGGHLALAQTTELVGRLATVSSWPAQLHICQSIRHLEIPTDQAARLAAWTAPLLKSKRPFLRAWSMDALQHLALVDPSLSDCALTALEAAEQDPAASVRARARQWRHRSRRHQKSRIG